jgi:oligosaccharide translocation protein RFT1
LLSAQSDWQQGQATAAAAAANVRVAQKILYDILRLYLLLAIVACAVGPAAAPLLLQLVAGARWQAAGAGAALAAYCYYVPLLALNGVAEAFVAAVATPAQLHRQSGWMLAFSAGFAGAGYVFLARLGWGAAGIVWANAVNMLLRVAWSAWFIAAYFGRRYGSPRRDSGGREQGAESCSAGPVPVSAILPRPATCAVGVGAAAILLRSHTVAEGGVRALVAVGAVGVTTVALMYVKRFLHFKLLFLSNDSFRLSIPRFPFGSLQILFFFLERVSLLPP